MALNSKEAMAMAYNNLCEKEVVRLLGLIKEINNLYPGGLNKGFDNGEKLENSVYNDDITAILKTLDRELADAQQLLEEVSGKLSETYNEFVKLDKQF